MEVKEVLERHPQGVCLRLEVTPGSSRLEVPSGLNPWRKALEVRLTERAEGGRANKQLLRELASLMGVPVGSLELTSGGRSSRKVVLVRGLDVDVADKLLLRALEGRLGPGPNPLES